MYSVWRRGCDGCIAAHARGAAFKDATPEEVTEAIGVAILMDGGPATVHGPRAFAAFQKFHERRPGAARTHPQSNE
jgi:alkylhydroperoxidase/carboxymuconolactone decarboxylase family protein YurZ